MKQIIRALTRNKTISFLNLLGLTLGLSCCFEIVHLIYGITSMDKFHSKKDQLFKVVAFDDINMPEGHDAVSAMLGPSLKDEIPEIENFCRYFWSNDLLIGSPDNYFKEPGIFADISLFQMFDFPIVHGNMNNHVFEPNEILISEKIAKKLFGQTNVTGYQINLFDSNTEKPSPLVIKGVFKDIPHNSTFKFSYVLPFSVFLNKGNETWSSIGTRTYVQVPDHSNIIRINQRITNVIQKKHSGSPQKGGLRLVPIINTTLYTYSGKPGPLLFMVFVFSLIGLSILTITVINYVNMAIAQSTTNTRKIAIRKVNGAERYNIAKLFIAETTILVGSSALLAYVLSPLLINLIVDENMPLSFDFNLQVFLIISVVVLCTIAASVFYPVVYLNRINPVTLFRGNFSEKNSVSGSREILVVTQFVLAIVIITSSVILWQQNRFIYKETFGMDRFGVVCFNKTRLLNKSEQVFTEAVSKNPGIASVTFTNQLPIGVSNTTTSINWKGKDPKTQDWYSYLNVGNNFLKTLSIKLKDGRDFEEGKNNKDRIIINSKAAAMMSMKNPIGEHIEIFGNDVEIVGIVEDFNHTNIMATIQPLFISFNPDNANIGIVKLIKGREEEGLYALKACYRQFSPGFPFDYYFLDDVFNQNHASFRQLNTATNIFGAGAIVIACIGLLGLSIFINERRRKEVGIRKVNGAFTRDITLKLYSPLIKWLLLSIVLAFPVAYLIMEKILMSFASRVSISVWPFLLSLGIVFFIVLISTGWYILRVASQNPVEALRYE